MKLHRSATCCFVGTENLKVFCLPFTRLMSLETNETHLVKVKQEGEEVEKSEPLLPHDLFFEVGL